MITSPQNSQIKHIQRLQNKSRDRRKEQAFVVEGVRLMEEAFQYGWTPEIVLYAENLDERGLQIVNQFRERGASVSQVTPEVMQAASDTETPQGLLAVLPLRGQPQPQKLDFVLIPDAVRDPGNLGTLFRTALAAGVDIVILPPGTVDAHSPKVVRAAMGAHFRLPIIKISWNEIKEMVKPLRVFVAEAEKGTPHTGADLRQPLALIIGNEARGPGQEAQQMADDWLHIPMPGEAESLNAAIAGSILMFEVVRQRAGIR
ncbi:MAG: RNA methyltransferase [Chloroflexota bacterium]|nr:RNA methyltransferase [Chloroflexota bacterium]